MIPLPFKPLLVAAAFLAAGFLGSRFTFRNHPIGRFVVQLASFAGFSIALLIAGIIPSEPTPTTVNASDYATISIFKVIWWLAASWLIVGLFHAVAKKKIRETKYLQDLFSGVVYICAIFAIISYVFDMPVRGLLAASGVIAIVLGLALQSTLGDVFSGFVLNASKPYHPGDWLRLDDGLEGRVVETNWRATQILTEDDDLATVPNSVISKAKLVNLSRPTRTHGRRITIRLEPALTPSRELAVLETALLSCNRILRIPAPTVAILSLDAIALECELQFFVASVEVGDEAQNEVFDLIHRHCIAAGVRLAPPPTSPFLQTPRVKSQEVTDVPKRLLDNLKLFVPLSDEERASLISKLRRRLYKAGDTIAEPKTVSRVLSILTGGVLVALQDHGTVEEEVVRLGPGDTFGEAGVLTGAATKFRLKALTKAVVYEIAKDDLATILKERPSIAAELSCILARRQVLGQKLLEPQPDDHRHEKDMADWLTTRIHHIFSLK